MKHPIMPWLVLILLITGANPMFAQLVFPEISIDLQRLPEEARVKLVGLDSNLTKYISESRHPWNRDDGGYDLPIQFSIYFTEYSPNPLEDKFKANLIVTNKNDIRYEDKRVEFGFRTPYQPGQGSYDSFFAVLEFYIWVVIGNEEDKYEKLGGDRYFDRARQVQLASTSSIYYFGWDKRGDLLKELTSENNKSYREFEFFYHTGLFFDEERSFEDSKAYLHYALLRLESLTVDKRNMILESEHRNLAVALKNCNYEKGIEFLRQMDFARKTVYDEIFRSTEEP